MPAGMSSDAANFAATLRTYATLSTRSLSEIIEKKGKSLSIELYKATRATSPTRAKIQADVTARGWAVKRPKGEPYGYKRGEKKGSPGPLRRMQARAVRRRTKAIGYVASGYLPAVDKLGGKGRAKDAQNFRRPRGSVAIEGLGTDRPKITIINSTPGIVAVEKKHHVTDTAFRAMTKDLLPYIERKQADTFKAANR